MLFLNEKGIVCSTDVNEHITGNYRWSFLRVGPSTRPTCMLTWSEGKRERFSISINNNIYTDGCELSLSFNQGYRDDISWKIQAACRKYGHWYDEGEFATFNSIEQLNACIDEIISGFADI